MKHWLRYTLMALSHILVIMAIGFDIAGYDAGRLAIAGAGLMGLDCTLWMAECFRLQEELEGK